MSTEAAPSPTGGAAARAWHQDGILVAWLLAIGAATVIAVAVGGGDPVVASAPVALAAAVHGARTAPLRRSAMALILLSLALDTSNDAEGVWRTPLAQLGDLLHLNLDHVIPAAQGVKLSGMEIVVLGLLGVAVLRNASSTSLDDRGRVPTATVLRDVVAIALGAVAVATVSGLARGGSGEVAVWQTRPLLLTFATFLLFQAALRGPPDHAAVGRVVVAAACVKAALATWVRTIVVPELGGPREYATNHGDSILFSVASAFLVIDLMERPDRKRAARCVVLLPLLVAGMVANGRRLAWLELGAALACAHVLGGAPRWNRAVARFALVATPILVAYGALGWSSNARVFIPVRTLRSIADARVDRSAWDRQVENWNLAMSLQGNVVLGRGFGAEWTEYYKGDDITTTFPQYHAQPHDQVLGLLVFAGVAGFAAIWSPFAICIFLAVRSHRRARRAEDRATALACVAAVVVVVLQTYGDMGPLFPQQRVLTALALAVAGKLAVATGAWPRALSRRAPEGA